MKFKAKPVIIEAHQWFKNGDHPQDDCHTVSSKSDNGETWLCEGKVVRYYRSPAMDADRLCQQCKVRMHEHGFIDTLESGHVVCPGDWIITGTHGERYPCKPYVFEKKYERCE